MRPSINENLERFPNIFYNFESENMVNDILEFSRLVVLIIQCFNWNTTSQAEQRRSRSRHLIFMFNGSLCMYRCAILQNLIQANSSVQRYPFTCELTYTHTATSWTNSRFSTPRRRGGGRFLIFLKLKHVYIFSA